MQLFLTIEAIVMAADISSLRQSNHKTDTRQHRRSGNYDLFSANSMSLGWYGFVSLVLHGAMLLMPEHFFIPPHRISPVSEIVLMVENSPNPATKQTSSESEQQAPLPEKKLLPPPSVSSQKSDADVKTRTIRPEQKAKPMLKPKAKHVFRQKVESEPVVLPQLNPAVQNLEIIPDSSSEPKAVIKAEPKLPTILSTTPNWPTKIHSGQINRIVENISNKEGDTVSHMEVAFGSDEGPKFNRHVRTRYPRMAMRMGQEGIVVLRLTIDPQGQLNDVEVMTSASPELDAAAVRSVRASTFYPALRHGRPVGSRAILPIRFKLRE